MDVDVYCAYHAVALLCCSKRKARKDEILADPTCEPPRVFIVLCHWFSTIVVKHACASVVLLLQQAQGAQGRAYWDAGI
jgi:hypothetical protein